MLRGSCRLGRCRRRCLNMWVRNYRPSRNLKRNIWVYNTTLRRRKRTRRNECGYVCRASVDIVAVRVDGVGMGGPWEQGLVRPAEGPLGRHIPEQARPGLEGRAMGRGREQGEGVARGMD